MSSIALETPLAEALSNAVHGKIVEEGWVQDDDPSLAEYIVLMLANGKTQDQIASELAGELLQDARGTTEFAQWLFEQVAALSGQGGDDSTEQQGTSGTEGPAMTEFNNNDNPSIPAAYEADVAENAPDNAPRGPRGLHGGRPGRGGRGGANNKGGDSVLHRTRGNDRINSHTRGAPKGPRSGQNRDARPGMQKALNNMGMQTAGPPPGLPAPAMQNGSSNTQQQQTPMALTAQQQMEFMAMMEQQARMMAQFIPGMMQPGMNPGFQQPGPPQQNGQGRSLFDRVESGRGRGGSRGRGRGGMNQNGAPRPTPASDGDSVMEQDGQTDDASAMSTTDQAARKPNDPSATMCHFNLRCTNRECPYVHQSPAAPDGTVVDMNETCSTGAACKNPQCVARHPSPSVAKPNKSEELCRFFPNCANPVCPFKHPTMPPCNFGANCKNPDCKFTHLQIPCRFNPCLNTRCPYKHEPGQHKTLADYTWTPETAKQKDQTQSSQPQSGGREHVSDRRFVSEEGEEELIKPEDGSGTGQQGSVKEEVIT